MTKVKFIQSSNSIQSFLIGGSPSTGSSLLRQILNRHDQIVCAPETHLFCKAKLYTNWDNNKDKLFKKSVFGLKSSGLFPFIGIDLSEMDREKKGLYLKLKTSSSFQNFTSHYINYLLNPKEGQIWGEKTPCNVLAFGAALSHFPELACIHLVRNPYDTIASLIARGKSPFEAACFYLLNTANGVKHNGHNRVHTLKYEDLVLHTKETLSSLLNFLNLPEQQNIIEPKKKKKSMGLVTQLKGWKYDETGKIGRGSLGRFLELSTQNRNEVLTYCNKLCLPMEGEVYTINSIAKELSYEVLPTPSVVQTLQTKLFIEKLKQSFKLSNYNLFNYPFYIND